MYLKAMKALRGRLVTVSGNEEMKAILDCMKLMQDFTYDSEEVIKKALQYCDDSATIKYTIVNTVMSDIHISLLIATKEHPLPEDLSTEYGVFAYVFNLTCDLDSELGYIFLEKVDGNEYRRIG